MSQQPLRLPEIAVWSISRAELAKVLTQTVARLSPARAGIVTDQLRELLRTSSAHRLIMMAAGPKPDASIESSRWVDCVLAIAILPESGDSATILHVDWVDPGAVAQKFLPKDRHVLTTVGQTDNADEREPPERLLAGRVSSQLWKKVEMRLAEQDIRFVQWATDPVCDSGERNPMRAAMPVSEWPSLFGFSRIGDLEYLAQDVDKSGNRLGSRDTTNAEKSARPYPRSATAAEVFLQPLAHDLADPFKRFQDLVQRTYVDSLDCPPLEKFRTVGEILAGYRAASVYSPQLWFTVSISASLSTQSEAIGCVMLARHAGPSADDADRVNPAALIELVYMGITPEHRGHGYGGEVMKRIAEICQQQDADRLILAVDQDNRPAVDAYRGFGMRPLFRETVWGRSVVFRR